MLKFKLSIGSNAYSPMKHQTKLLPKYAEKWNQLFGLKACTCDTNEETYGNILEQ